MEEKTRAVVGWCQLVITICLRRISGIHVSTDLCTSLSRHPPCTSLLSPIFSGVFLQAFHRRSPLPDDIPWLTSLHVGLRLSPLRHIYPQRNIPCPCRSSPFPCMYLFAEDGIEGSRPCCLRLVFLELPDRRRRRGRLR